mmetsp:Transcript_4073/g.6312  ORF Transcript_4073/g.6312 Transcript_4073/m.6312 type:complete len:101 (-) Transcript_4073:194-496(-)
MSANQKVVVPLDPGASKRHLVTTQRSGTVMPAEHKKKHNKTKKSIGDFFNCFSSAKEKNVNNDRTKSTNTTDLGVVKEDKGEDNDKQQKTSTVGARPPTA